MVLLVTLAASLWSLAATRKCPPNSGGHAVLTNVVKPYFPRYLPEAWWLLSPRVHSDQ